MKKALVIGFSMRWSLGSAVPAMAPRTVSSTGSAIVSMRRLMRGAIGSTIGWT